jgi:hypothetical protein
MELVMKKLVLALAAIALTYGGSAIAQPIRSEPVTLSRSMVDDGYAKLRKNCDQRGRCWTEGHRNPLRDSYNFVPMPRRVTSSVR